MQCSLASVQQFKKARLQRSDILQPKQCFVCAKFAQNKGKTLCSLLVFTQLFEQEIRMQYFSLSLLSFLDYMYLCVLEKNDLATHLSVINE